MEEIVTLKNNLKFKIFSSKFDLISNKLRYQKQNYAPWNIEISSKILLDKREGNILDIGAHIGTFSIPLAKNFPNLTFLNFEVQKKVFDILNYNINLNNLKNIKTFEIGLSDQYEKKTVSLPDYDIESNIGAFSLDINVRINNYEVKTTGQTMSFNLVPLDKYNLKNILLIKLDVEGYELNVLRGAINTIKNNNYPPILFETWIGKKFYLEKRGEIFNFLENCGYTIKTIGYGNDNIAIKN